MRFGLLGHEREPVGLLRRVASMACLVLMLGSLGGRSEAANLEDEVRSTFERYVAAQNAHDEKEVSDLLSTRPTSSGSHAAQPYGVVMRR